MVNAVFQPRVKMFSDGGIAVFLLHHFSIPKAIAWKISAAFTFKSTSMGTFGISETMFLWAPLNYCNLYIPVESL